MQPLSQLTSQIGLAKQNVNHWLAKVDAGESVPNKIGPLRGVIGPGLGIALGGASMAFDIKNAPLENRKKVAIRDGLVLGGIALTSILASIMVRKWKVSEELLKLFGKEGHSHAAHEVAHEAAHVVKSVVSKAGEAVDDVAKKVVSEVAEHGHHHAHDHVHAGEPFAKNALGRVKALFQSQLHDHGLSGALDLTILSALPIFGGGVAFGTLADKINGEDWKTSFGSKLKEGIFQFMGNITMCTVAILAFSTLGRQSMQQLWKLSGVREWVTRSTERELGKLSGESVPMLKRIPSALSAGMEQIMLAKKGNTDDILHDMYHYFQDLYKGDRWKNGLEPVWEHTYKPMVEAVLNKPNFKRKEVHQVIRQFFDREMKQDLATVLQNKAMVQDVAKARFTEMGQLAGVVGGVFGGVVGGAWVSNILNKVLTDVFHLPEGHVMNGLFRHHHGIDQPHHPGHPVHADQQDNGFLAGKLGGPRGLHWFDGIMHLDDGPSALYLSGVQAVESLIQVLYGISGYLAGTAGVNYAEVSKTLPNTLSAISVVPKAAVLPERSQQTVLLPETFKRFQVAQTIVHNAP